MSSSENGILHLRHYRHTFQEGKPCFSEWCIPVSCHCRSIHTAFLFPVLVPSLSSAPAHTSGMTTDCAFCRRKSHSALTHTCRTGVGRKAKPRWITWGDSPCPMCETCACTAEELYCGESASYRSIFRLLWDSFFCNRSSCLRRPMALMPAANTGCQDLDEWWTSSLLQ